MAPFNYRECVDIVRSTLTDMKSGMSAEDALIKRAKELELPGAVLGRCCNAYNAAKSLNFFDKEPFFKGASFRLIDPEEVVSRYVEPGQSKSASAVPEAKGYNWNARYPGIPMDKRASEDKFKVEDTLPKFAAERNRSAELLKVRDNISRLDGICMDMASEVASGVKRAFEEIRRLPAGAFDDLQARASAEPEHAGYEKTAFAKVRDTFSGIDHRNALSANIPAPRKGLVRPEHAKLAFIVSRIADAMAVYDEAMTEKQAQQEVHDVLMGKSAGKRRDHRTEKSFDGLSAADIEDIEDAPEKPYNNKRDRSKMEAEVGALPVDEPPAEEVTADEPVQLPSGEMPVGGIDRTPAARDALNGGIVPGDEPVPARGQTGSVTLPAGGVERTTAADMDVPESFDSARRSTGVGSKPKPEDMSSFDAVREHDESVPADDGVEFNGEIGGPYIDPVTGMRKLQVKARNAVNATGHKVQQLGAAGLAKAKQLNAGTGAGYHPTLSQVKFDGAPLKEIGSAAGKVIQGIGNTAAHSPFRSMTEQFLSTLGDGDQRKVDSEMSRTKLQINLERLMLMDPVIRNADPDLVVSLANSIHTANPGYGQDINALKSALRETIQYESMPMNTRDSLAKGAPVPYQDKPQTPTQIFPRMGK